MKKLYEEFQDYENLWEDTSNGSDGMCEICHKKPHKVVTSFKQYLCPDCDEEYLNTEKGKLEIFVRIALGSADASDYTAQELEAAAKSWSKYRWDIPFSFKTISNTPPSRRI